MAQLRVEADETAQQVEELKTKNKSLESENLAKEQEITSLSHRNQILEQTMEKLETQVKELKDKVGEGDQHSTQNENLARRVQVLEDELEAADRSLRETNEKYVLILTLVLTPVRYATFRIPPPASMVGPLSGVPFADVFSLFL